MTCLCVKVHVLHLGENSSELVCQGLYSHRDEIWDIAACPYNKSLFTTVYSSGRHAGNWCGDWVDRRFSLDFVLCIVVYDGGVSFCPIIFWFRSGNHLSRLSMKAQLFAHGPVMKMSKSVCVLTISVCSRATMIVENMVSMFAWFFFLQY